MERRYPAQPIRRSSRTSYTDDDDQLSRMSDLEGDSTTPMTVQRGTEPNSYSLRRRSSSVSLTASPSSSSQKMSIDSDDARSISSVCANRSRQLFTPTQEPPLRLTRSLSSELTGLTGWTGVTTEYPIGERTGVDEVMMDPDNARMGANKKSLAPAPKGSPRPVASSSSSTAERSPYRHHHRSASSSSAEAGTSSSGKRPDPERRTVNRRSSLLPRSKTLARVLRQADEETRLADLEMRREHDITQQIKNRLGKMSMDTDSSFKSLGAVPAAAWARIRDGDPSPTIAPYQCSKLNPEMEITNFQFDNLPSPVQQSFKSVKRKASEDRFDRYPTSSLKRRAVSPSVSASGSPVLSAVSSPSYSLYGSSPTSNAAARAQQKPSSSFNLQDASGGISRMSLSE